MRLTPRLCNTLAAGSAVAASWMGYEAYEYHQGSRQDDQAAEVCEAVGNLANAAAFRDRSQARETMRNINTGLTAIELAAGAVLVRNSRRLRQVSTMQTNTNTPQPA